MRQRGIMLFVLDGPGETGLAPTAEPGQDETQTCILAWIL